MIFKAYLSFFCLAIIPLLATAQIPAFDPLQPSQPLNRELRVRPLEDSSILRMLQDDDQIRILRSEGEWFEVDVLTPRQVPFRGWVKGGVPVERQIQALPKEQEVQKAKSKKPLQSKNFRWVWLDELDKEKELSFLTGYHLLELKTTGLQDVGGTPTRLAAPGYSLTGFDLGLGFSLPIMQTRLLNRDFFAGLEVEYSFGLFSVTFGSGSLNEETTIPSELAGVGYSVTTHNLQSYLAGELLALQNSRFDLSVALKPGIFFFESAPDLRRTAAGNVVFTQIQSMGLLSALEIQARYNERFGIRIFGTPVFLSSFSEETGNANEQEFSASSLPLLYGAEFQYRMLENLLALIHLESYSAKLKKTGTSSRINEVYEDLNADLSYLKVRLGIELQF